VRVVLSALSGNALDTLLDELRVVLAKNI
jgi:hypothetical protein